MVFGISPQTQELHESIELLLVYVVRVMESSGWLVGGDMKLLIEKEKVVPGLRVEVAMLLMVTIAFEVDPEH